MLAVLYVKLTFLSNMGCSALDEHARSQKHQERDQSWNQSNLSSYFSKTSTNSPSNSANEQSECRITPEGSKTVDHMIISESTLNAENLWILKVIQLHFSFRSCEGINKLFTVMFPDSEISFNL